MRFLPQLFANNRAWAAGQILRDPGFFERLCAIQKPEHLADARGAAGARGGIFVEFHW